MINIKGFEGRYKVSHIGYVFSMLSNRILEGAVDKDTGYRIVRLVDKYGTVHSMRVHTLVNTYINGDPPSQEYWTCHKDGDKLNNAAENLYWGTPSDNNSDTVKHGRNINANKLSCPRGHTLSDPNLRIRGSKRECLACARARTYAKNHPEKTFEDWSDIYYLSITEQEVPKYHGK